MMVKSLPSRYAFVLTGTPLENRIDELCSIFQFLDPRILGPLWHFNDRFYELEKRESGTYKVPGYKNIDQLRALIKPYILRRTRDEVLKDLPERTDNNFFVEMTEKQWDAYNEFKEELAKLISASKRRPLTPKERELLLMYMIKMRLICNALALHDKEIELKDCEKTAPKLGELDEILTEEIASNGHKAVIFSQWATMLALTEPILNADSSPQTESPRESDLLEPLAPSVPLVEEKLRARESDPPQRVWRIVSNASRKTQRSDLPPNSIAYFRLQTPSGHTNNRATEFDSHPSRTNSSNRMSSTPT